LDNNFSFYSPVPGYPALRNAICAKLKNENGLEYKPEEIVCSNGAKQSVCNVILAVISKGDEVIIPAPFWVSYPEMVTLADGKSVIVSAVSISYPNDTCSTRSCHYTKNKSYDSLLPIKSIRNVYSKEELEGLANVLAKFQTKIIF
jgi:aspartate aminotransferase